MGETSNRHIFLYKSDFLFSGAKAHERERERERDNDEGTWFSSSGAHLVKWREIMPSIQEDFYIFVLFYSQWITQWQVALWLFQPPTRELPHLSC